MEETNATWGCPWWRTNVENHIGHTITTRLTEDELYCVGKLKDHKGAGPTRADNMNVRWRKKTLPKGHVLILNAEACYRKKHF